MLAMVPLRISTNKKITLKKPNGISTTEKLNNNNILYIVIAVIYFNSYHECF